MAPSASKRLNGVISWGPKKMAAKKKQVFLGVNFTLLITVQGAAEFVYLRVGPWGGCDHSFHPKPHTSPVRRQQTRSSVKRVF